MVELAPLTYVRYFFVFLFCYSLRLSLIYSMCFDLRHFILFYLMRPCLYPPSPPLVSPCSLLCCPFGACEMHFWWQLMEFLLPLKRALWWPDQNTPHLLTPLPPTHYHSQSQLTWHLFVLHGTGEEKRWGEVCVLQMIVGGWLILLKAVRHLSSG